jgi:hypothetical protein
MKRVLVEVRTSSNRGIQFFIEWPDGLDKLETRTASKLINWIKMGEVVKTAVIGDGQYPVQYVNFGTVSSFSVREVSQD